MGSGLKLRVAKFLDGADIPRNGVVANVYALDPQKGKESKRNIVIPVGSGTTFEHVNLVPGAYLVEALLPSGDIISQEATSVEGHWKEIELQAEHSAHEWHSLHNLLGNVESHDNYYRKYETAKAVAQLDVWLIREPPPELISGSPDGHLVWKALDKWIKKGPKYAMKDLGVALERSTTFDKDDLTQLHTFVTGASEPPEKELVRWYSFAESTKALKFMSVPVPWFSPSSPTAEIPVKLLVRQTDTGDLETSFSVLDQDLCTALGYMARGSFQSAALLVNNSLAVEMLFEKVENPLGAAAGAYLLLGSESFSEQRPWHSWIKNLMNYFPWLPDGAIQYAWLHLQKGVTEENRIEARKGLSEAFNRGIPFFTLGLQWMVDGLTLCSEKDEELKEMLRAVQQVAWRTDMSQTFTSIAISR